MACLRNREKVHLPIEYALWYVSVAEVGNNDRLLITDVINKTKTRPLTINY